MLDNWKRRRETQRVIAATKEALAKLRDQKDDESSQQRFRLYGKLASQLQRREIQESAVVARKARKRSAELPSRKEKPTWYADDNEEGEMPPEAVTVWLSEIGRRGVSKLIKLERRADVEWWWTKIILPALAALVPILALILGLVSVSKK